MTHLLHSRLQCNSEHLACVWCGMIQTVIALSLQCSWIMKINYKGTRTTSVKSPVIRMSDPTLSKVRRNKKRQQRKRKSVAAQHAQKLQAEQTQKDSLPTFTVVMGELGGQGWSAAPVSVVNKYWDIKDADKKQHSASKERYSRNIPRDDPLMMQLISQYALEHKDNTPPNTSLWEHQQHLYFYKVPEILRYHYKELYHPDSCYAYLELDVNGYRVDATKAALEDPDLSDQAKLKRIHDIVNMHIPVKAEEDTTVCHGASCLLCSAKE